MLKQLNATCPDHSKPVFWYCFDCSKPLCKKCVAQHSKHSFTEVTDSDVQGLVKESVSTVQEQIKDRLTTATKLQERLLALDQSLEDHKSRVERAVHSTTKSLQRAINSLFLSTAGEIESEYTAQKSLLTQALARAGEEQRRRSERYRDFTAMVEGLKSLDICSQLKYAQKLTRGQKGGEWEADAPGVDFDRVMEIGARFEKELERLLRKEVETLRKEQGKSEGSESLRKVPPQPSSTH